MGNRSAKPNHNHNHNLNPNQISKKTQTKHNKATEKLEFPRKKPPSTKPLLFLFGDPNSSSTSYLRFILHYKPLTLRFIPHDSPDFKVRFDTEDDPVSGTLEAVLEHVESILPSPPLLKKERKKMLEWLGRDDDETTPFWEVVKMGVLQHRSMRWHLEKMVEMGKLRRVWRWRLGSLGKCMGVCWKLCWSMLRWRSELSCPFYYPNNLDNCNQHFDEEERNMFPLMETADLNPDEESKIINQCIDVMQATHSHLFRFFIEGLLPHEAMEYLDLIGSYIDKDKLACLLRLLIE